MFIICVLDDIYRIFFVRNLIFCILVKIILVYICICWLLEWKILKIILNIFLNVCILCFFSKRVVVFWISIIKFVIGFFSLLMFIM